MSDYEENLVKQKYPDAMVARALCENCQIYHYRVYSCTKISDAVQLSGEGDTSDEVWELAAANINPNYHFQDQYDGKSRN